MTACSTWQVQAASPADVLAGRPKLVRLTLTDGSVHAVHLARIDGDSIVGVRTRPTRGYRNEVAYPLSDVARIEMLTPDSSRTWGAILGTVVVLSLWLSFALQGIEN